MQAAAALEPAFAAQLSPAELRRAGQVVANLRPNPNPNPDPNPNPKGVRRVLGVTGEKADAAFAAAKALREQVEVRVRVRVRP